MIIRKIQSSNFWTPPELEYSFLFLLLFNFFSYFQNISILFFQFVKKLQNFLFYIGVYPINNVVIVWSGQQRDSAIHIHEFILPQTPLLLALADAEAEAPVFLSSDANSRLIGKVPDAGKDWEQKEKRVRGWDGWMASPMRWTWTWANFRRWWGRGRPGMLQSMGSQRVRYNWATEQQRQQCLHAMNLSNMHNYRN